ncbi:Thymidine kinase [Mycoplasmopsis agalactiae]|uniref:Thymidine kinase n=1 Tax=Mycoplasmopsis agalactiae (strain NCTC 10123 / CIP 59.7 / PG2) TaxID=347257 RepID=A5IZE2_MYCAP|nr:thymidine kinase [Mycoplasmopsis agalactiae]MCE6057417.1 thymidine kinase [Mycoplasmopsis agalactiae]MCE6079195.1 thymidine kinase [Mycoplasmopsis agalactiae]MCE6095593.1 thymidine kinase [Mycoplasmopsis agalactiae]MCE6114840.1 thymidine kinase [Mycoplasmopsis agalactiae]NLS34461.1 thymidine kinase [Mycoplasmopsis agalactiae]
MYLKNGLGQLEVITGPMFSGKTEELLKRINILKIAGINSLVIKPKFDTRFSENEIVSRTGAKHKAINVSSSKEILDHWSTKYMCVAIDEVNFMDEDILSVIEELIYKGVKVICSGLDMDFKRRPFDVMAKVLASADSILKLKAVCLECKSDAGFSFRKVKSDELNLLGDSEYEARCRICHIKGEKEKAKM